MKRQSKIVSASMFAVEQRGDWGMLLGLGYCSRTVRHTDILQCMWVSGIMNSEMLKYRLP